MAHNFAVWISSSKFSFEIRECKCYAHYHT